MTWRGWIGAGVLLVCLAGIAFGLRQWKKNTIEAAIAASANQPEPMETITVAVSQPREYRPSTTSIGTVSAVRSITLKNEIAGTVKEAALTPGQIVEAGAVLIAMDVSVEQAELKAHEAQLVLAEAVLSRAQKARSTNSIPEEEVDRARGQRDVALAQIGRSKAVIARKTIRAPFKAKIGISDVHPGQYLAEGTQLTTLQGVDTTAHVDFAIPQMVASGLREGDTVEVFVGDKRTPVMAKIVAVDARVDSATRNAMIRARIESADGPGPGAAVRVRVSSGPSRTAIAVPASALRKGPGGDHVFVIAPGPDGKSRAKVRPVVAGTMLGDEILLIDGVKAGETIASSGSFKLRDGLLVVATTETQPK